MNDMAHTKGLILSWIKEKCLGRGGKTGRGGGNQKPLP